MIHILSGLKTSVGVCGGPREPPVAISNKVSLKPKLWVSATVTRKNFKNEPTQQRPTLATKKIQLLLFSNQQYRFNRGGLHIRSLISIDFPAPEMEPESARAIGCLRSLAPIWRFAMQPTQSTFTILHYSALLRYSVLLSLCRSHVLTTFLGPVFIFSFRKLS